MALNFIANSSDDDGLLWLREYLKTNAVYEPETVLSFKHGAKGLIVYTPVYKAYVWSNSKLYDGVIATLHLLASRPELACPIVALALRDASVSLAVDEDGLGAGIWIKAEESWKWKYRDAESQGDCASTTLLSPELLARIKATPHTHSAVGSQLPNAQNPASRKPRKEPN